MSKITYINSDLINASELARMLGVTPQYIKMILSGKRKATKMRKKIKLIIESELLAA